jgi:predicted DNA-binding ribbon-helix-helix protein
MARRVISILWNLQEIIAINLESPKNRQLFSKISQLLSEKRHSHHGLQNLEKLRKAKQKTESITFRLESQVLDYLLQEGKRKDVSINTLVSQIARQHTNWHSTAAQAGFISVRKLLITKLLESQNEEQIKSLAGHVAKSSNKDFILMSEYSTNLRVSSIVGTRSFEGLLPFGKPRVILFQFTSFAKSCISQKTLIGW